MLLIGVVTLLTACTDAAVKEWQATAKKEPLVERPSTGDFDPADTDQEVEAKAEARGIALAKEAIRSSDEADQKRGEAER
jgi:hypothetical protein